MRIFSANQITPLRSEQRKAGKYVRIMWQNLLISEQKRHQQMQTTNLFYLVYTIL